MTVAEVLADPDKFVGETLADPLEGTDYGRCKAKVMRAHDGTLVIHSSPMAAACTTFGMTLDLPPTRPGHRRGRRRAGGHHGRGNGDTGDQRAGA